MTDSKNIPQKCIIHLDLDCFYCQVEHKRLNITEDVPLVVSQWDSLIAVNYAARAYNINRHDLVSDALKKCKHLKVVHVATIKPGESEPSYDNDKPKFHTHKISLDYYRRQSDQIIESINSEYKISQKVSIDEIYIDVTEECSKLNSNQKLLEANDLGVIEGTIDHHSKLDVMLLEAAKIAKHLRQSIHTRFNYKASAGISYSKVLAKIGSGLNKPNNQTLILFQGTEHILKDYPIAKFPRLGGKLGQELMDKFNCENIGQLWSHNQLDFTKLITNRENRDLYKLIRGLDNESVNSDIKNKTVNAVKSFRPLLKTHKELDKWIELLCIELHTRIVQNQDYYNTYNFKNLVVSYRLEDRQFMRSKTVTPVNLKQQLLANNIIEIVKRVCYNIDILPCSRLSLSLSLVKIQPYQKIQNTILSFTNNKPKLENCYNEDSINVKKKPKLISDYFANKQSK